VEFKRRIPVGANATRYTAVLEREQDGGYVVSVPALPGCISQGDTRPEALANIREAIERFLEDCRASSDPVPTEVGKEFVEVEAASDCRCPRPIVPCRFSFLGRSAG
jgi:antitoxin HicB